MQNVKKMKNERKKDEIHRDAFKGQNEPLA